MSDASLSLEDLQEFEQQAKKQVALEERFAELRQQLSESARPDSILLLRAQCRWFRELIAGDVFAAIPIGPKVVRRWWACMRHLNKGVGDKMPRMPPLPTLNSSKDLADDEVLGKLRAKLLKAVETVADWCRNFNQAGMDATNGDWDDTATATNEASQKRGEGEVSMLPDGLFGADGFRLGGVEVRFRRAAKRYRLVKSLWDAAENHPSPPRDIQAVLEEVYGTNCDTSDAAFRQLCSDTRNDLAKHNCPITIDILIGTVCLRPTNSL